MTQTCTYTQDDLIRYLYNETSSIENVMIEEALLYDDELLNFYLDCLELKIGFDKIQLVPSERAVQGILDFSLKYQAKA